VGDYVRWVILNNIELSDNILECKQGILVLVLTIDVFNKAAYLTFTSIFHKALSLF